jgi:hypothetical protein
MHKPDTSPPGSPSPSAYAVLPADDDRIAEEFEQLLRSGQLVGDLQDRFAQAMKWTENEMVTPALVQRVQHESRRVLRAYLAEGKLPVAVGHAELVEELHVTHDGAGHLTIELPNEVRRCLLQLLPSTISF